MMKPIESSDYFVFFDANFDHLTEFLKNKTYSKVFVLTDDNTGKHCLPLLQQKLPPEISYDWIEVDAGEENKNIDYCIGIWRMLLDFGAERDSLLINLGGGVVTDMGGFAASTYKRGIDFVQIPTTLLSQVDASIGGKTGIDFQAVKNIIGTFAQPEAVFICTPFLETLDKRQLISGFAEMVKHGLIADEAYYNRLKQVDPTRVDTELIYRSVEIKNDVVKQDPTESGLRKILNFGHTIGHAIESYSLQHDAQPLLHGEAIAIGMICEGYLSKTMLGLADKQLQEMVQFIRSVFPDYPLKASIFSELLETMKSDKKNKDGQIGFALLDQIGRCQHGLYASESDIQTSLRYYASYTSR